MKSNNAPYQKRYMTKRKAEFNERIRQIKATTPCVDCGGLFHFSAVDFDHVEDNKTFGVAQYGGYSWERILAEIAKCEVVCSNCHRVRTWKRRHNLPL